MSCQNSYLQIQLIKDKEIVVDVIDNKFIFLNK